MGMMIRLELSEQMVAEIGNALNNHPFRLAAPILAEIQKQINEQQPKPNGGNMNDGIPLAN